MLRLSGEKRVDPLHTAHQLLVVAVFVQLITNKVSVIYVIA